MTARFSERVGAVKIEIQLASLDNALRNSIWNLICHLINWNLGEPVERIAEVVFRIPIQHVSRDDQQEWLLNFCFKYFAWHEWYDLLEYVVDTVWDFSLHQTRREKAQMLANQVLVREHSGYRFVGGQLAPVTNANEIEEIQRSIEGAAATRLDGVRQHIEQALSLFGIRPEPDYRNAIKEANSAVEGVVKLIEGTKSGGLHAALDTLSERIDIHNALKVGLEKLYGYTSDEDGIRHQILDKPNVDETDARFMIVTCSAFVNFLISKTEAARLLKKS